MISQLLQHLNCLTTKRLCYPGGILHDLVLGQTGCFGAFHGVAVALVGVANPSQTKGPATILVAGELLCYVLAIVFYHKPLGTYESKSLHQFPSRTRRHRYRANDH
jgi:hypothetical protein